MSFHAASRTFAKNLCGLRPRTLCSGNAIRLSINHISTRKINTTPTWRDRSFTNLLADSDNPPPVQVSSITDEGIQLEDGLLIPSACVFLEGHVFLWDVPAKLWEGWGPERFELFETAIPRPEMLILGTGRTLVQPPPTLRSYLTKLGIQLDVMDTRNACSTYNLLSEEGRRVAAALLPLKPQSWQKIQTRKASSS